MPADVSKPLSRPQALPILDPARCTGCGRCVTACPTGAVRTVPGVPGRTAVVEVDASRCDYCGDCEAACPEAAIDCPIEIVAAWTVNRREETNP